MERKGDPRGFIFSTAAAAVVLSWFMARWGAYIRPQAALPVIFALLAFSVYRSVTEDSAEGFVTGAAVSFFLLHIFYLNAGIVPWKPAVFIPSAGMLAVFFGLEFAGRNGGKERTVDSLRYWKSRADAKGFASAFLLILAAAESALLYLLVINARQDQFVYALTFFTAGVYGVSAVNRLLVLVSSAAHSAAGNAGRVTKPGFGLFRAAAFTALAAVIVARSIT